MNRPPATHPHTVTTRAVTDSLGDTEGRLPAGSARPRSAGAGRRARPPLNGPVITLRPPAGRWVCDGCHDRLVTGRGWVEAEDHAAQTGHRVFTALNWDGTR